MEMICRERGRGGIARPLVQDLTLGRFSWPARTEISWWWWNLTGVSSRCSQQGALQQSSLSYSNPLPKKCVSVTCFPWLIADKWAPHLNVQHSSSQPCRSAPLCAGLEIEWLRGAFRISLEITIPDDWTNEEGNMKFLIEDQGFCWGFSPHPLLLQDTAKLAEVLPLITLLYTLPPLRGSQKLL